MSQPMSRLGIIVATAACLDGLSVCFANHFVYQRNNKL